MLTSMILHYSLPPIPPLSYPASPPCIALHCIATFIYSLPLYTTMSCPAALPVHTDEGLCGHRGTSPVPRGCIRQYGTAQLLLLKLKTNIIIIVIILNIIIIIIIVIIIISAVIVVVIIIIPIMAASEWAKRITMCQ